MSPRRSLAVSLATLALLLAQLGLLRAMAHGHVAHVLLGSGNATPPLGAAALAIGLLLVRLFAIVIAPGLLLAAATSLLAQLVRRRVS